ncbi:MAG TPA: hypothetical protein VF212_14900 [Longimicrobiales bacterium]
MAHSTPIWAYVLAALGGVAAMFAFVDAAVMTLFVAFAVLSGIFGVVWPNGSWRWGLWTSAPLVLTVLLGVVLEGTPRPVDGLVLFGVPLFGGAGGSAGARLGARRIAAGA